MFTMDELLMNRAKLEDLSDEIQANLTKLLEVMNAVRVAYAHPMTVTSGYRRAQDNDATSNAAKASAHLVGMACDIRDTDGAIMKWVLENLQLMKDLGIFLEDFRWTRSKTKGYWVHFGIRKPASGHRIFVPSTAPAESPDCWDGEYDKKAFDEAA